MIRTLGQYTEMEAVGTVVLCLILVIGLIALLSIILNNLTIWFRGYPPHPPTEAYQPPALKPPVLLDIYDIADKEYARLYDNHMNGSLESKDYLELHKNLTKEFMSKIEDWKPDNGKERTSDEATISETGV